MLPPYFLYLQYLYHIYCKLLCAALLPLASAVNSTHSLNNCVTKSNKRKAMEKRNTMLSFPSSASLLCGTFLLQNLVCCCRDLCCVRLDVCVCLCMCVHADDLFLFLSQQ